jgi:hypothetical protein
LEIVARKIERNGKKYIKMDLRELERGIVGIDQD